MEKRDNLRTAHEVTGWVMTGCLVILIVELFGHFWYRDIPRSLLPGAVTGFLALVWFVGLVINLSLFVARHPTPKNLRDLAAALYFGNLIGVVLVIIAGFRILVRL